jgi:hypothetical protein
LASVSLADKAVVLLKALECLVIGFLPPENFWHVVFFYGLQLGRDPRFPEILLGKHITSYL